jgi:magnesium chelatase family protein
MERSAVRLYAAELRGIEARIIEVEVDIRVGLHSFVIVGLADKALNEARERVNAALGHIGVKPPHRENRKITVNLAPADSHKTGSYYDLAIALGYLGASGQIRPFDARLMLCVGELALDGRVRPVRGVLSIADRVRQENFTAVLVPHENAWEAAVIPGVRIVPVAHIRDAIAFIQEGTTTDVVQIENESLVDKSAEADPECDMDIPDLGDIRGHAHAKRALTIAAAGGHNVLLCGPPGVGKSMLAAALPGILPPLTDAEAIEVTKIHSAAGLTLGGASLVQQRPVRMPHQTASLAALIGGGADPAPGELSLAHRGVLFLDELPEFPRHILDALRSPLETRVINLARARHRITFPANCMLVAAMNPCPCGFFGDDRVPCTCTAQQVAQYARRISGPLMDRIDIVVRMERTDIGELETFHATTPGDPVVRVSKSREVRALVMKARAIQQERFSSDVRTNSDMTTRDIRTHAHLDASAQRFLKQMDAHAVSARSYYRLIKMARTIADMEGERCVTDGHVAEAYTYRFRDRGL